MEDLTEKHCIPCEGDTIPLTIRQAEEYLAQAPGWELRKDAEAIAREWKFKNFKEAMAFVNSVASLAESEGHHPDIHVSYNRVQLELSTHAIGGLSGNDFILAAKLDEISF